MQCTNSQVALLSNYEVLSLLKTKRSGAPKKKHRSAIESEVYEYLTSVHDVPQHWTDGNIRSFLEAIYPHGLFKSEKLILLNVRPRNLVGFIACIEEADERFDNQKLMDMFQVIEDTLPLPPEPDMEEQMET